VAVSAGLAAIGALATAQAAQPAATAEKRWRVRTDTPDSREYHVS